MESQHLLMVSTMAVLAAVGQSTAFCRPGQSCWPLTEEWATFNASLGGALFVPEPPQLQCRKDNSSSSLCQRISRNFPNESDAAIGADLARLPGAMISSNYECQLTDVTNCCHDPAKPCRRGAISEYAVKVARPQHIKAAVKFAKVHNLQLVVKGSGHDLNGRSTAAGSLMVWMHHFRGVSFDKYPGDLGGCNATAPPSPRTNSESSDATVTVLAGTPWGDVYAEADKRGVAVVGAYELTRSAAGGSLQGGSHSPLSPLYGLPVDNLLEAKIVTADGEEITVRPCGPGDHIFWALRGGGGGTFGIVTSATYATHPLPENMVDDLTLIYFPKKDTKKVALFMLNWLETTLADHDDKFTIYLPFVPQEGDKIRAAFKVLFAGTMGKYMELIKPLKDFIQGKTGYTWYNLRLASTKKYLDWFNNTPSPAGGARTSSSRFVSRAGFQVQDVRQQLADVIQKTVNADAEFYITKTVGGAVSRVDNHLTPIAQGYRDAAFLAHIQVKWGLVSARQTDVRNSYKKVKALVKPLQEMFPNSGAYWNEADYFEANWTKSFWGKSTYDVLAQIKSLVDPSGLFKCWNCVGGLRAAGSSKSESARVNV